MRIDNEGPDFVTWVLLVFGLGILLVVCLLVWGHGAAAVPGPDLTRQIMLKCEESHGQIKCCDFVTDARGVVVSPVFRDDGRPACKFDAQRS